MRSAIGGSDNRLNSRRFRSGETDRTGKLIIRRKRNLAGSNPGWSDDDREFDRELFDYDLCEYMD
ncbi:MAG TPA: hypothetical protein VIY48_08120 [Candidatus Paceibacterota bacterium]